MNGVAVLAGSISTALFVVSALPMLYKAARTRALGSDSLGNLLLANVGNGFYAIYVFSMPVGPIWALHSFYMLSSALMLVWYLRYELSKRRRGSAGVDRATAALPPPRNGVEHHRSELTRWGAERSAYGTLELLAGPSDSSGVLSAARAERQRRHRARHGRLVVAGWLAKNGV
jgi:hypothetical protein